MTTQLKYSPYGWDMSLFTDIRRNASADGGIDIIKNAIAGRILDYNLWYSTDYGYDLIGAIRFSQPSEYGLIAQQCEDELLKDDRIATVNVEISQPNSNNKVFVTISGQSSTNTPFELIGNINTFNSEDFSFI